MKTIVLLFSNIVIFVLVVGTSVLIVPLNMARKLYRKDDVAEYLFKILLGQDQVWGSTLYGTEDFTTSSWTYYLHSKGNKSATYFMHLINGLAYSVTWILFKSGLADEATLDKQKKHCMHSYYKELYELKMKSKG
jgi:hypothetical protein